jgi:hypothetical protein
VEELNYLGRIITNDASYTQEITGRITVARTAFSRKTNFLRAIWT